MALTKVSTAMFDTAAQSSDLNIDANTLFVDVSTNRVGIGTTSPSVPLEVSGQLKAGGILYPTSDGSNGQALVTDGSGTASFATVAPTAGTGVTVSGTTVSIGQAVGTSSNVTFNNLVVSGTLTVNGATNTNSATNTTIEDILIELGTGTSGSPANDAGLVLERGSSDNVFIGWDESADTFTVGTGSFTGASSGNLTITPATAVFGGLTVDTSTLVVDASNNRVGIGNASPDVSLDIGSFTDAVHVPVGTTAQRPTGAAGYFRYNSTLGKFEGYTDSWGEIGGGGSNTFTTNVYTGDGTTTAFTLSQSVSNVNNLIVFIDGVYQVPTAAYTVSGTTLTMTAAPANTRKIVAYSVQSAISGTNLNQNSFTGNGSAVAFTLSIAPVNENNTQVFLDGVYQHKSTYATSGTTLTFDTAPASGVAIEVMIFTQTEINVPVDGTITTAKIVNDAVTADKIVDNIALAGNITTTGTLAPTGVLTANAGVVVDNITIDGQEIDVSSGDLTIDVAGDMTLDAAGNQLNFAVGGTTKGRFEGSSDSFVIRSVVSDGDLIFRGNDGGSPVTAMTIDMSEGGNVGIGVDTPDQKLMVKGTIETVATNSANGWQLYAYTDNTFRINYNGSGADELVLDTSGRLKFGDAPQTSNNMDDVKLQFGSNYAFGGAYSAFGETLNGQTTIVGNNIRPVIGTNNQVVRHYNGSDAGNFMKIAYNKGVTFHTGITTTQGTGVSEDTNERMRIDTSGNVGIGTTPSGSRFHVVSSGTGVKGRFSDGTSETLDIGIHENSHAYLDQPNGGPILFTISSAEQARISSAGIALPSGKGIDFSATGDASGMSGELLDDYEEGTWTPLLISGGSTNPTGGGALSPYGSYTKVGNRVTVTYYVGRSWTNTPAGQIFVSGLPFTIKNVVGNTHYHYVATYNINFNGGMTMGVPDRGASTFNLYAVQNSGGWTQIDWTSHTSSPIYLSGEFSYIVD